MLQAEMVKRLNKQLNLEFYSSNLYMQMSAWCDYHSLNGIALFLRKHAQEELQHMQRLFDHLLDTGAMPLLEPLEAPPHNYQSVTKLFEKVYQHEVFITEQINDLVDYSLISKDYSTFNFLQWYVAEQHEEEKLFKTLLDKLQLVGEQNKEAMFFVDKDFEQIVSQSTNGISVK